MTPRPNEPSSDLPALLEKLSRDLETQKHFLRQLRSAVKASKARLPEGSYGEETGEPLDMPASFRALYDMLEEDYFEELAGHLAQAQSWLGGAPLPIETSQESGSVGRGGYLSENRSKLS